MPLNPYESPGEVTDQVPRTWYTEVRQILYALSATVISALYLLWRFPRSDVDLPLPIHHVLLLCFALGGVIAGPFFFLISLVRWLIAK
jgi:hypothetical protein